MENVLLAIGFDMEDFLDNKEYFDSIGILKISSIIELLRQYHISNFVIKEILLNKPNVFTYQLDQLSYILDAIISNNDPIEETLLEII